MNHTPDDPLNDSTLARELEALVDVDPSPEFLARVRTRIALEPEPSSWKLGWGWMGAAAAAVLVAVALVSSWTATFAPIDAPQQAVVPEDVTLEPAATGVLPMPDTTRDRAEAVVRRGRPSPLRQGSGGQAGRPAAEAPLFAEVLISENEQRAFAQLLTAIGQGRLPAAPDERSQGEEMESIEPPALEIPELVIEPLPQIARLESGE